MTLYVDDLLPSERPVSEVHIMSDEADRYELMTLGEWIVENHPDLLIGWVNRKHPQFLRLEVRRPLVALIEAAGFELEHCNSQEMCYIVCWPDHDIMSLPPSIYHMIRADALVWIKEALGVPNETEHGQEQ